MDLVKAIYHEKQEAGSMLCAQHALNNLLQSSMFTAQDLAEVARGLDALEAAQLDPGTAPGESPNYDDSGFFSIMVMEEALKVFGLKLVRWKSQEMKDAHDNPERMEGFVLNHQLHWYTIRRFAKSERFYNLDSCIPSPAWISPTFLGLTLREAENQGYSIFVVVPTEDAAIAGLPSCEASIIAQTLPSPSSRYGDDSNSNSTASTSKLPFEGTGNVLGSGPPPPPIASTSSSAVKGKVRSTKRRPEDSHTMVGSSDDDVVIVEGGTPSTSSVEEESEKRRRRRRIDHERELPVSNASASPAPVELSEEDQMALAIAESLRASKLGSGQEDNGDDDDEVIFVDDKASSWSSKGKIDGKGKKQEDQRRGDVDEDAEFEAALKASLQLSAAETQPTKVEVEEEDDSPSVEELRRRRLARFGG